MTSDDTTGKRGGDARSDPAIAAFARVRSAARNAVGGRRWKPAGKRGSAWGSGPGPDTRDPQPLGRSITRWVSDNGYELDMAVAGITGQWEDIVGPAVAEHVQVAQYTPGDGGRGGTLALEADSPEWALEMRYQVPQLLARIAETLGPGLVANVDVRRPASARSGGRWRIRSGRRR